MMEVAMKSGGLALLLITAAAATIFACTSGDERLGAENDCSPTPGTTNRGCTTTGTTTGSTECAGQDAVGVGSCDMLLGVKFDGVDCVAVGGCECSGADCGALSADFEACQLANRTCCLQTGGCQGIGGAGSGGSAAAGGGAGGGGAAGCPSTAPASFDECPLPIGQCCQYPETECVCAKQGAPVNVWQCGVSACP